MPPRHQWPHGTTIDDRGRIVHTFRQSTLDQLDLCLERGRHTLYKLHPHTHSDATAAGESMHAGIEWAIQQEIDSHTPPFVEVAAVALGHWDGLIATGEVAFKGWSDTPVGHTAARRFIEGATAAWYAQVQPSLRPIAVEQQFGPLLLHEDDERVIYVTGTIDYLDRDLGLVDWKTAGRAYEPWEKQRWAIQPTVYTWAASQCEWGKLLPWGPGQTAPFTYVAFLKGGFPVKVQVLTVNRGPSDWAWLAAKCLSVAILVEADIDQWPVSDSHALCSPKWCDAWATCKGAHYSDPSWMATPEVALVL